mgnify:CR=1 FL=1
MYCIGFSHSVPPILLWECSYWNILLMPEGSVVDERVAARIFLTLALYSPGRLASKITMPWLVQVLGQDAGASFVLEQETP